MRILLYILIWAAILFLPNRLLTTEPIHEYLGLIFLLLGGIHLVLVTLRLRVTPLNTVNSVMLILLLVVIATGIMISLYAVPIVRLRGLTSIYVHGTHLAAAVLFYLIVGIHAGFHWRVIWNGILRRLSLRIPEGLSRVFDALGILLIIAGLHAFVTTHIYEKILYEHLSFGGIVGTWQYQLDLALIFAACMSAPLFFERLRMRK
ncbi:DUF4405 domain-containing protein [Selenomonas sp. oral taxon 138]|uniref:DUF4405 domain-containing protein n=1 Tax=Selenomonas sp. oral taxon 138 TaxID=712532 RepID=UPI0002A39E02|nr:DUF4405 domain-containing protein [Selenomonas sp. oral taxon 138]EKX96581.1 hypothetical protein HMPREF9163_01586 [Selenomonas sp. oral taxon 138 str. F0429]